MAKIEYNYNENPPIRMVICIKCGNKKVYHAKDMCTICYAQIRNKKRAEVNNMIF